MEKLLKNKWIFYFSVYKGGWGIDVRNRYKFFKGEWRKIKEIRIMLK